MSNTVKLIPIQSDLQATLDAVSAEVANGSTLLAMRLGPAPGAFFGSLVTLDYGGAVPANPFVYRVLPIGNDPADTQASLNAALAVGTRVWFGEPLPPTPLYPNGAVILYSY